MNQDRLAEIRRALHESNSASDYGPLLMADAKWLLAELEAAQEALLRCCEETDYCYACDNHPSSGHDSKCPLAGGEQT